MVGTGRGIWWDTDDPRIAKRITDFDKYLYAIDDAQRRAADRIRSRSITHRLHSLVCRRRSA